MCVFAMLGGGGRVVCAPGSHCLTISLQLSSLWSGLRVGLVVSLFIVKGLVAINQS